MSDLTDFKNALSSAKSRVNFAEAQLNEEAEALAELLVGRLRIASKMYRGNRAVATLKKELRAFNMHTGRWSD